MVVLLALLLAAAPLRPDDWPQWRGPRRDGVWRESGIVEKLPAQLPILWRAPVGEGYSGPAVVGSRVYLTDRILDQGQSNPEDPFSKAAVGGTERVLCLDGESGKVLWKHQYPARYAISYPSGPRATPTVQDDRVYALGAMGDLSCLRAAGGEVLWSRNLLQDFQGKINTWGLSAAPLLDGDRVIVLAGGAQGAAVVA